MEKSGNSRLLQMKARFQQKQLQERELKIASLYEAQQARALDRVRQSPSNGIVNGTKTSPPEEPKVAIHPGKVRQMFEERRTKGIDKSYPLQPIHNTDKPGVRKALPNGFSKVTASNGTTNISNTKSVEKKKVTTRTTVKKTQQHRVTKTDNIVNGAGDLNHNHELDMNSVKHKHPQSNGEQIPIIDELDRVDNNYLLENETFPDALAPEPTPRSPEPKEPKRPPRRSPPSRQSQKAQTHPVAPPRRAASDNTVSKNSPRIKGAMQCSIDTPIKKAPSSSGSRQAVSSKTTSHKTAASAQGAPTSPNNSGGEPCSVCGRRFAPDRLQKHEEICRKAANKKRKPFDALKHRLAGTEAEPFINKLRKQAATSSTKVNSKPLNSNWRKQHEEFINAIRAAKQVQAHVAAGGKLSDLPPPPPSENPDYVQCPHCKRRFNSSAAERHIPKCASFQFNKPKPQPSKSRR